MPNDKFKLDRRTFLRGLGTAMALPCLEAMMPSIACAAGAPQRFVAIYLANGVMLRGAPGSATNNWEATGTESNWALARAHQPLANFKNDITLVQGLVNDAGQFGSSLDSGTAHWLAGTTFLTGQNYDYANRATRVALYQPGASIDQMIAAQTPNAMKSLVMGTMAVDGYPSSEARGSNKLLFQISWASQTQQVTRLDTSAAVFNRLFGGGTPAQTDQASQTRAALKKSVLDAVREDARKLMAKLGTSDKQKLDEYFTSVEEVERRIAVETQPEQRTCAAPSGTEATRFTSDTNRANEQIINLRARNMIDLMTLAFQCDITRVATLMLDNEHNFSNLNHRDGANGQHGAGHHDASHYQSVGSPGHMDFVNTWQCAQLAYLLGKFKATADVSGTLLDNSLVLFGSGMGDSDSHSFNGTPTMLAGRGAGFLPGRLIRASGAKYSNFLQTVVAKFGITGTVGRSNGSLPGI